MPDVDDTPRPATTPLLAASFDEVTAMPPRRREWLVRLFVLLAAVAVLIPNAGSFGLWDCWETHYGEVARYMQEMGDFLSPWWGYKDQIGTEPRSGEWFFSKPILIMYGEILMFKLIGLSEWAIRLPVALLGIAGVFMSYVVVGRIFGRRGGLLAAGALLTAPLFFFLSRQAITDMPFVGTLTIGLLFFVNAYFGPRFTPSNRGFVGWMIAALALFLLSAVPQFINIALDLEPEAAYERLNAAMRAWMIFQKTGLYHALIYIAVTAVLLFLIFVPMWREHRRGELWTEARKDFWMRRFSLWAAYVFLGYATMGKGLLGFMLPGALLFLYFLITSEWRAIKRLEVLRGTLMMCLVMLPWYLGMFAKHGNAFYNRFLVHDHFNRLGAGVHQLDSGSFEHFIKWLAIGTFPWVAFAPLVIWGIARLRLRDASPQSRTKLFFYIWTFFAYLLFTLSATKFHHYIFPALPPFILLVGILIHDLLPDRTWWGRAVALTGVGLVLAVGLLIRSDQQAFRNMFTYKYDRALPTSMPTDPNATVAKDSTKTWENSTFYEFTSPLIKDLLQNEYLEYETFVTFIIGVSILAFLLMLWPTPIRLGGVVLLWAGGVALALWCLNYYMPMLSPAWSQKYMIEDYFKECTPEPNPPEVDAAFTPLLTRIGLGGVADYLGAQPKRVCKEDIVAWLITWRGETYYTSSEIKPLMKATQLGPYLETLNKGVPFYALTQGGRATGLKTALDRETEKLRNKGLEPFVNIKSWEVTRIHDESAYFSVSKATPVTTEEAAARPATPADDRPDHVPEEATDSPPPGM